MTRAFAVIGANYGDEGKGLVTDYLASLSKEPLVVRYNGGAQAGHTVATPDNKRHVFHHFGSGSFVGARTFLSRFFISSPILFLRELEELKSFGLKPTVYVDGRSPLTTPYDIMINQLVETARGSSRHGSCGVGINETVTRQQAGIELTFADLVYSGRGLPNLLKYIRDIYVPKRLKQLREKGIPLPETLPEHLRSQSIVDRYVEDCIKMRSYCVAATGYLSDFVRDNVIFEGAQGLRLDADYKHFPHVTRSKTGLTNVMQLAADLNVTVEPYYVTRAYMTRHGAGPLERETEGKPFPNIVDKTNIPHDFQGTLRFGHLDIDDLDIEIITDTAAHNVQESVVVTCLDQIDDKISFWNRNHLDTTSKEEFLGRLQKRLGRVEHLLTSVGPTRQHVSDYSMSRTLQQK